MSKQAPVGFPHNWHCVSVYHYQVSLWLFISKTYVTMLKVSVFNMAAVLHLQLHKEMVIQKWCQEHNRCITLGGWSAGELSNVKQGENAPARVTL